MRTMLPAVAVLMSVTVSSAAAQKASSPQPVPPAMEGVLAEAANLPEHFTANRDADPVMYGDRVCPVEYVDDRDGTVLRLVRSVSSRITRMDGDRSIGDEVSYGDYWIPGESRYGVELGRALRIDCVTGAGIGIVARFE